MNAKLALPVLVLAAVSLAQGSTGNPRQLVSPTPSQVEEFRAAGGGVPPGYMLLGETQAPPPGYSFARASLAGNSWWTPRGTVPSTSGQVGAAAVGMSGRVYLLGGGGPPFFQGNVVNSVNVFDPSTQTWTPSVPMPTGRSWFGAAELNGRIIIAGGWAYPFTLDSVEEFDPVSNSWSSLPPLRTPRYAFGAAVVNGKLYAAGGSAPGETTTAVEAYDPTSQTWSPVAPLLTPRTQHAAAAANGRLYVFGGLTGNGAATAEEYDPITNSWRAIESPMMPSRTLLAGVGVRDRVFALGGRAAFDSPLAIVEEYDPVGDRWIPWIPMQAARIGPAAASTNGLVFLFGGVTYQANPVQGVEELEPGVRLFVHRKN